VDGKVSGSLGVAAGGAALRFERADLLEGAELVCDPEADAAADACRVLRRM